MNQTIWHGCYDGNWNGLITPESFLHPAKMANGLTERIFDYAFAKGWLKPGDTVVDPFGGIGSTAIIGASRGIRVVCCELEQRFVDLAKRNFELHRRTWEACGDPLPVIVQGDSRRLCEVLGPLLADCVVGSPPFQDDLAKVSKRGIGSAEYGTGTMTKEVRLAWANLDHEAFGGYLRERRESLGLSKAEVDRRIGTNTAYSFYEGRLGSKDQWRIPMPSTYRKIKEVLQLDDRFDSVLLDTKIVEYERRAMKMGHTEADYGVTDGQLGAMPTGSVDAVVGSPPFSSSQQSRDGDFTMESTDVNPTPRRLDTRTYFPAGQDSEGNLAAMKPGEVADAIVSSPPYEGSEGTPSIGSVNKDDWGKDGRDICKRRGLTACYGETDGQIGHTTGDTFWSAARAIVQQCYQILKPGGICIWVVKSFVRAGAIVDFPGDWRKLCEAVGFEFVEEIHASLVKEDSHPGLFGDPVVKRTERKGFFRRLHQKKYPHLAIDWEVVLCVKKPA